MEQLNVDNPNSFKKLPARAQNYFFRMHNRSLLDILDKRNEEIKQLKRQTKELGDQIAKNNLEIIPEFKRQIVALNNEIQKVSGLYKIKANFCEVVTRFFHEKGIKQSFDDYKRNLSK